MKRLLAIAVAAVLAMGVMAPAGAAPAATGEQINVLAGEPTTFAPDTAFHVKHWWSLDPAIHSPVGGFGFELTLDGVAQGPGISVREIDSDPPIPGEYLIKWRLYNFPDGLAAGDHEFIGTWYAPCKWAVAEGGYTEDCKGNQRVPYSRITLGVTFGAPSGD